MLTAFLHHLTFMLLLLPCLSSTSSLFDTEPQTNNRHRARQDRSLLLSQNHIFSPALLSPDFAGKKVIITPVREVKPVKAESAKPKRESLAAIRNDFQLLKRRSQPLTFNNNNNVRANEARSLFDSQGGAAQFQSSTRFQRVIPASSGNNDNRRRNALLSGGSRQGFGGSANSDYSQFAVSQGSRDSSATTFHGQDDKGKNTQIIITLNHEPKAYVGYGGGSHKLPKYSINEVEHVEQEQGDNDNNDNNQVIGPPAPPPAAASDEPFLQAPPRPNESNNGYGNVNIQSDAPQRGYGPPPRQNDPVPPPRRGYRVPDRQNDPPPTRGYRAPDVQSDAAANTVYGNPGRDAPEPPPRYYDVGYRDTDPGFDDNRVRPPAPPNNNNNNIEHSYFPDDLAMDSLTAPSKYASSRSSQQRQFAPPTTTSRRSSSSSSYGAPPPRNFDPPPRPHAGYGAPPEQNFDPLPPVQNNYGGQQNFDPPQQQHSYGQQQQQFAPPRPVMTYRQQQQFSPPIIQQAPPIVVQAQQQQQQQPVYVLQQPAQQPQVIALQAPVPPRQTVILADAQQHSYSHYGRQNDPPVVLAPPRPRGGPLDSRTRLKCLVFCDYRNVDFNTRGKKRK